MKPHAIVPYPMTPPDDPPEPDLSEVIPCPTCGCKPEWDHYLGKHHLWCHGFRVADSDLGDAIRRWDETVIAAGDDEGENRKAEGVATVTEHNEAWMEEAIHAIDVLAFTRAGGTFTVEDLRRLCPEPKSPNAWGAAFSVAAKKGLIVACGYTANKLPSAHARIVRVWRGKR